VEDVDRRLSSPTVSEPRNADGEEAPRKVRLRVLNVDGEVQGYRPREASLRSLEAEDARGTPGTLLLPLAGDDEAVVLVKDPEALGGDPWDFDDHDELTARLEDVHSRKPLTGGRPLGSIELRERLEELVDLPL
jgi:hypothetical protein